MVSPTLTVFGHILVPGPQIILQWSTSQDFKVLADSGCLQIPMTTTVAVMVTIVVSPPCGIIGIISVTRFWFHQNLTMCWHLVP
jgi:hypothetical protein